MTKEMLLFFKAKTKNQPTNQPTNPEKMYLTNRKEKEKTTLVMLAITLPHTYHNGTYLITLSFF